MRRIFVPLMFAVLVSISARAELRFTFPTAFMLSKNEALATHLDLGTGLYADYFCWSRD